MATAPAAFAEILTVDCAAGPFFDISPAVDAAAAGDTVLVRECVDRPYGRFAVRGKTDVHILAALGERPQVVGDGVEQFCIDITDNSERVSIEGFTVSDCISGLIQVHRATDTSIVGNDLDGSIVCVGDSGLRTRIIGNTARGCTTAYSPNGEFAWVTQNRATDGNISIGGDNNTVVENFVTGARFEGLTVFTGSNHRVERNRSTGNQRTGGGTAEVVVHAGAVGARVIGNFVDGAVIFDVGDDTEIAGNE